MSLLYAESGPLDLLETGAVMRNLTERLGHVEGGGIDDLPEGERRHWVRLLDLWRDGRHDERAEATGHYHRTRGRT